MLIMKNVTALGWGCRGWGLGQATHNPRALSKNQIKCKKIYLIDIIIIIKLLHIIITNSTKKKKKMEIEEQK